MIFFRSFKQAGSCVDEWYNAVLKQLALLPSRNHRHLFGLQDQDFLAMCLSKATTDWSATKIRQMTKILESSKVTTKHMRSMPASQPQAQVNQLKHQRINFAQYEQKGKKRKPIHLTNQSQGPSSKTQQHSKLPQTKNSFMTTAGGSLDHCKPL